MRLSVVIKLGTADHRLDRGRQGPGRSHHRRAAVEQPAFVVQGGVIVALLAVTLYEVLSSVERVFARRAGRFA